MFICFDGKAIMAYKVYMLTDGDGFVFLRLYVGTVYHVNVSIYVDNDMANLFERYKVTLVGTRQISRRNENQVNQ